jgi:hypothetical protein
MPPVLKAFGAKNSVPSERRIWLFFKSVDPWLLLRILTAVGEMDAE